MQVKTRRDGLGDFENSRECNQDFLGFLSVFHQVGRYSDQIVSQGRRNSLHRNTLGESSSQMEERYCLAENQSESAELPLLAALRCLYLCSICYLPFSPRTARNRDERRWQRFRYVEPEAERRQGSCGELVLEQCFD